MNTDGGTGVLVGSESKFGSTEDEGIGADPVEGGHHPLTPLVPITILEQGWDVASVIGTKPMYTPPSRQPVG